jgi:hypothetical protein
LRVLGESDGTPYDFPASYRAVALNIAQTANGVLLSLQGSASKTVIVTRVGFSGLITTTEALLAAIYRTTGAVSSPVGAAAITPVKMVSATAAATAAVNSYTSATLGAASGLIEANNLAVNAAASGGTSYSFDFGTRNARPIVLAGVAEFLQLQITAASFTGASFSAFVEFNEK